jgi:plasmid maintenance system antidote protein VapI
MPRRIPDEKREEIIRLYDNGGGMSPAEIARQTGVSYSSVYGLTKVRQRVNPETGEPFESQSQYQEYTARQRVNPETGEPFESLSQYQEYTARQRVNRPENQGLSDLINRRLKELRRNQAWLAEEMGVTRQAVSLYVKGRSTPTNDLLQRLYSSLDVPYETLDDLLEDLNIG